MMGDKNNLGTMYKAQSSKQFLMWNNIDRKYKKESTFSNIVYLSGMWGKCATCYLDKCNISPSPSLSLSLSQ